MVILAWFNSRFLDNNRAINWFHIINLVFLIFGISSLVVGLWLYLSKNYFIEITPASYSALSAAGLCVFTGATILIITIIGFVAINWRNRYILISYVTFVALLIVIHSITRITGFFYRDDAENHLRTELLRSINTTYVVTKLGKQIPLQMTWDHLQYEMKCCGVDSYRDWFYSVHWPKNKFVPDSCCNLDYFSGNGTTEDCGKHPETSEIINEKGCLKLFFNWLSHHVILVNWISSILIVVEVIVLLFGFMVIQIFNKEYKRKRRRRSDRNRREDYAENLRLNSLDRIGDAHREPQLTDDIQIIDSS